MSLEDRITAAYWAAAFLGAFALMVVVIVGVR